MIYRILIVEDDAITIASLKGAFNRLLGEVEVFSSGFATAIDTIAETQPDAVVLDIYEDQVEGHSVEAIEPTRRHIWEEHFCPMVYHSAHDMPAHLREDHPFVRYEPKLPGSQERVVGHIKSFAQEISGLRAIRHELARRAGEALRHVSRLIWKPGKPAAEQTDQFLRVARRRMAAALDYALDHEKLIQPWEQYIFPPIGLDLLTGDLIHASSANASDFASYRLVLSPSCDLVRGRAKTLVNVLVAECVSVNEFLAKAGINPEKFKKPDHRAKLLLELSKDQVAGLVVMPKFPDVLPLMAVNLKNLSLVPYTEIATARDQPKAFFRIASVDSPFRERLAWAYLQVAGRPGVPEVDREALADSISQALTPSAAT